MLLALLALLVFTIMVLALLCVQEYHSGIWYRGHPMTTYLTAANFRVEPKIMWLAPLWFVVYTLFITIQHSQMVLSLIYDNPPLCCQSKCGTKVVTTPIGLLDIVNDSPTYVQVESPTIYTEGLDNVCHTFLKNNETSYTLFTGLRYSNESSVIQRYTAFELPGYCGVIRYLKLAPDSGSCTFIYDEVCLGSACPRFKVYYRNYAAGPCEILGNISKINGDFLYGDSTSRETSDCCKRQVAAVANSHHLRGTEVAGLPNLLNRVCVTLVNGASVVNAERVLPQDSVSVNV